MNDKANIIKIHKLKIDSLKKHSNLYYNHDNPKISDSQFDSLKKEILNLENNHPFLKKNNSVDNIVGTVPLNKFKKIKHLVPMLSLSNAFNKNDMNDFVKKINNFLSLKSTKLEFFAEPKIDGISATLVYEKGILTKGLSRGDGIIGEDILQNLKTIESIPKKIQ